VHQLGNKNFDNIKLLHGMYKKTYKYFLLGSGDLLRLAEATISSGTDTMI
jgi:hypothetical protein